MVTFHQIPQALELLIQVTVIRSDERAVQTRLIVGEGRRFFHDGEVEAVADPFDQRAHDGTAIFNRKDVIEPELDLNDVVNQSGHLLFELIPHSDDSSHFQEEIVLGKRLGFSGVLKDGIPWTLK